MELQCLKKYSHYQDIYFNTQQNIPLNIESEQQTNLWKEHCCQCQEDENYRGKIAESCHNQLPIIVLLTLCFDHQNVDDDTELYDDSFIVEVILAIQETIYEFFNLNTSKNELLCCLLKSDKNFKDNESVCTQLILHFPFTLVDRNFQNDVFRPKLISILRKNNPLAKIQHAPIGDWDSIITLAASELHWPLYRCCFSQSSRIKLNLPPDQRPLFSFYGIYGQLEEETLLSDYLVELDSCFNPLDHSLVKFPLEVIKNYTDQYGVKFWLSLLLSLHFSSQLISLKNPQSPKELLSSSLKDFDYVNNDNLNSLIVIKELLPLINSRKNQDDIGKAIYNVEDTTKKFGMGLLLWKQWMSGKSEKEEELDKKYASFNIDNHLDIKTLALYAKEDNPEKYHVWFDQWLDPALREALKLTHTDIARALYRCYWLDYICANIEKREWYYFDGIVWKEDNGGNKLNMKISNEFLKVFENYRLHLLINNRDTNDDSLRMENENIARNIAKLINKLKTVSFKSNIMSEAARFFYQENFHDIINTNPNLFPVSNGVIETVGDMAIFRKGKPQDFFTMRSDVRFPTNYTMETPQVKEVLKWWHQVFPDPDLFQFAVKIYASHLRSRNSDKIIPIHTGPFNNSKSMMKKFTEHIFGPFSWVMPNNVWTQNNKNGEGGPLPEVAGARYAKIVWLSEPKGSSKMVIDFLKTISGGDRFFSRKLHENGGMMEVMFKTNIVCNQVPGIDEPDKAAKGRFVIIPYDSIWMSQDEAPKTEEEQNKKHIFVMNTRFEDRLPYLASAGLWLLVHYYHDYRVEGLKIPGIVAKKTKQHIEDNDPYYLYIEEQLRFNTLQDSKTVECPKGKADDRFSLSFMRLYSDFQLWFKHQYPGEKIPGRDLAKYQFEQRLGPCDMKKGWTGWSLNNQQQQDSLSFFG